VPESAYIVGICALVIYCLECTRQSQQVQKQHAKEREEWRLERNALLERLVPGSTPKPDEPVKTYPLGDDRREWLMSLDDETRQMVEREREEGLALR
jgi:hypothetical protein